MAGPVIIGEVLDTIRDFAEPLTVLRTDRETLERGYAVPGTTAVLGVSGHMQFMSDRELRMVPEGMNTMEWYNIWALQQIKVDDFVNDSTGVVVRVLKVKPWKEGPFWHAQGVTVEDAIARTITFPVFSPEYSSPFA